MTLTRPTTSEEIRSFMEANGVAHVKLGVVDLDGIIRGKYLAREKFLKALESDLTMCKVVFGWDCNDELYNARFTGWHNGFPDDTLRIVPETARFLPEENTIFVLCEFSGQGSALCPRNLAQRVIERTRDLGYTVFAGFEYEFFAYVETAESARAKGYRNLAPLTPSSSGYSVLRSSVHHEIFNDLLSLGQAMDFPLEGLHPEAGEGAMEAAIAAADGIEAADRAVLFKTFSKVLGQRRGIMFSFMARPSLSLPGCGGHLHVSLKNSAGEPAFFSDKAADELSDTARHFIGGQQRYMRDFLSMTSPTVNAFSRLAPGFWAPTTATWGHDNRTCALRALGDSPTSKRVEYRISSADSNPYLVLAAALASGMAGIAEKIEPDDPVRTNAYELETLEAQRFPRTLHDAAGLLRSSETAKAWLGDDFVAHYATTREFEEAQYRQHVSDWESHRYFELM